MGSEDKSVACFSMKGVTLVHFLKIKLLENSLYFIFKVFDLLFNFAMRIFYDKLVLEKRLKIFITKYNYS